uniref:Reverse transcriptase domain-containing protein n=1 Tax=Photinus pyralis TaxID=7054 RepID=A0A1Y1MCV0_PHOPY
MENGHMLIYSGVEESTRAKGGVGCILHRNLTKLVHRWEGWSERILEIELKDQKGPITTIISVYGPNEDEKAEKKDEFWEELNKVTENARGKLYIAGDFNSRVGKKDSKYKTVLGEHGEEIRNNNGNRLLDFCTYNGLIITNSFFKHRDIHKFTRVQRTRQEESIIDYILAEIDNRRNINDTRVSRRAEINSDHYLVVSKIKGKIGARQGEGGRKQEIPVAETIKSYKLKEQRFAEEFTRLLEAEIERQSCGSVDSRVEGMWTTFKCLVLRIAKQVCGTCRTVKHKKQTAWWNEEIKEQVRNKKRKWKKYLSTRTIADYMEYKQQRERVKRLVIDAKQRAWTDFGEKIEEESKGNQKLFFKMIKTLRKGKTRNTVSIRSREGEILTTDENIMNRWKEYFQELLEEAQEDSEEFPRAVGEQDEEENLITLNEMMEAIRKIKLGKAPGHDKITGDMLKNLGVKGRQMLLDIFNKAFNEETVPTDWDEGLVVPIFKKGDPHDCGNYRGITLLSTTLKLYERILERRLRTIIETTLSEPQSGFRPGRSVQDHIFTIKQIIQKTAQKKSNACFAFIDLEKAFDKVPRKKVWKILYENGINGKLIRVVQSLYQNSKNRVIKGNLKSESFTTKAGLRQGGVMSPLLFTIFMDNIIKQCQKKINKKLHVGYKNMTRIEIAACAFADDIVITAKNQKDLQDNLDVWNKILAENGMKINKNKTKVMSIAQEPHELHIYIEEEKLEQVTHYTYLGVQIDDRGNEEGEINERIQKAARMYYALNKNFISKKEVSRKTKMMVYKVIFRPILTYGSESWTLGRKEQGKIQTIDMKYLRRVKGITRRDHIRNEDVRKELQVQPITEFIVSKQLSWWGHLQRMSDGRQVKQIWEAKIQHKRGRGRPRQTWEDTVGKTLKKRGKSWTEARNLARDRKEWTRFVHDSV